MEIKPEGPGLSFLIAICILIAVSTITITLRVFVRLSTKAFGVDDWLMVSGWAIFIFCCACDLQSISYGVGAHADRISPEQEVNAKKWYLFAGVSYAAATAPVKASICVLLMRITPKRLFHLILWGVIGLSAVSSLVRFLAYLVRCRPIQAAWDERVGHCGPASILVNVSYFFGAMCILTDWICAILPIFIVWNIQLSRRIKIHICVILALGIFASTATIVRMKYLTDYEDPNDYLYGLTNIAIWAETECCIGILAGSLATMRPLLRYTPWSSRYSGHGSSASVRRRTGSKGHRLGDIPNSHPRKSAGLKLPPGYTYQVNVSRTPKKRTDEEDGSGSDGDSNSQRHILTETRLEIYKESHIEVTTESGNASAESGTFRVNP